MEKTIKDMANSMLPEHMSMENLDDLPPMFKEGYYTEIEGTKSAKDETKPHKVFVYGSLLKGLSNHRILGESECLGSFSTELKYKMLSLGGFPMVLKARVLKDKTLTPPSDMVASKSLYRPVLGEVYEVDDQVFKNLDRLEGNGSFYNRELIRLKGFKDPCWMYIGMSESPSSPPVPPNLNRELSWMEFVTNRK